MAMIQERIEQLDVSLFEPIYCQAGTGIAGRSWPCTLPWQAR
jgi:hypothetical protein